MTKTANREGACIPSAYEDINGMFKDEAISGDVVVVHGWVYSDKLKTNIKHAWLEFVNTGHIWEPVNQVFLTKKTANKLKMKPIKKYSYWDILKISIKTGSKGGEFEF